jgi:NAD(P)-dependent dehydrogenase (short-subunit alcohol dehydrogenase family)
VIEAAERRFGQLNVMMANAGIGILCKAIEMSLADWRRQTAINLDGVFLSVKYAVPAMRRAGGGSIIITSSVAAFADRQGWPVMTTLAPSRARVAVHAAPIPDAPPVTIATLPST